MKKLAILALVCACTRGEHRDAREKYNSGLDLIVKGDYETAEKTLLEARSGAGVDPDLRFRAAYNLGLAYAAHADKTKAGSGKGESGNLAKALDLEQQAVSWFSDAARLRAEDADTKANLSIVRARAQAMSDQLRAGEGKLEARLDALIGEQRGVLEEARTAWVAIKQTGGADPLAQQGTLTHLADKERGTVAEAGVIGDLASEEIDSIGKKAEDKRTEQEKVRVIQLKNLDLYLLEGRARIAEARRKLQDLAAEDGVARAEAALVSLKRAREQLLDPITVLKEVAGDELTLIQQTQTVLEHDGGQGVLDVKPAATPAGAIPAWMEPPAIAERQGGLRDRVEEIRARLAAATTSDKPPEKPLKPEDQKMLERLRTTLPFVTDASAAMDRARSALGDKQLAKAGGAERDALIDLAKAIEQFADLKQTIDLASETQKQLVHFLAPEAAKEMPTAQRITETKDGLAQNITRMGRIKELLTEEVGKLDQQQQQLDAKAAGAGSGSAAPDPKQVEAAKQQLDQAKQQLTEAETLRGDAEKAIAALDTALKANHDPLTPAKLADAKLDELRRLFFTVIEHLQELIRQQGETRDQTSEANGEDDFTRGPKLPALDQREDQHAQLAKAITDALAKQSDAAAKSQGGGQSPQSGQPSPQQQAKSLSAAADEVRLAQGDMTDAKTAIGKAQTTTNQSVSLKPAVESEGKAIEHLENALKLLQPPQKQNQDQKDQKDQDKQQQDAQKQKKDQQQQPQQGGAGQRARDEDAKRQREKRNQNNQTDPVEKDW